MRSEHVPNGESLHRMDDASVPCHQYLNAKLLLCCLFLVVQTLSFLIPPFQSPDEFSHIKRAYLLSQGQILPQSENESAGGAIDVGLLEYMAYFESLPFQYSQKIDRQELWASSKITWANTARFSSFPETADYFPLAYLPQALALLLGQKAGLSVDSSYYLARLFSLCTVLLLLWTSFSLYPVPLATLAVFLTPMSLFQLGSASLDAVTFGVATLSCALFMRYNDPRLKFGVAPRVTLFVCLFILITTRFNLAVLAGLPLILYFTRRSIYGLLCSLTLVMSMVVWMGYAASVAHPFLVQDLTPSQLIKYYLIHPGSFLRVFLSTFTNLELLKGYWSMFVGVLGWLDTPLDSSLYVGYGVLFFALALICFQRRLSQIITAGALSLSIAAVVSFILLFAILLVTWTPPARGTSAESQTSLHAL